MSNHPERRFGLGANRLAGLTAQLLGWLPDQFWAATPAELITVLTPHSAEGQPLARSELNRLMELDNA